MNLDQQFAALDAITKAAPPPASADAAAAKAADAAREATPQTLHVGIGNGIDTHIPLPHWLDDTLGGMGARALQLGQGIYKSFGGTPDPLNAAVARQTQSTTPGKVGSFLTDTLLTAPIGGAAAGGALRAGGLLARVAANPLGRAAIEGATQGALTADPGQRLQGAATGAAFSPLMALGGSAVGKLVKGLKRTPEAQQLIDEGVDLTPGLMNPESQRNASEEAAQSLPVIGAIIARARNNALRGFQQRVVSEGAAPGTTVSGKDVQEMLDSAYRSFDPLYDQAKGFPTGPVIMRTQGQDIPLKSAFTRAVADKSALASNQDRKIVGNYLQNELSRFNGKSDSLLDMRSNVRAKIREAKLAGNTPQADLLKNGEQAITMALESQLPKDALSALRTADSKYGTYKVIEDAVARAKDRSAGLTPTNLQDAVAAATPRGAYARGGGGPLRDLAQAGKAIFDVRSPPTGARVETLLPGMAAAHAHPFLTAPFALGRLALTATPTGRALAQGTLAPQQWAQRLLGAANPQALEAAGRYGRSLALAPLLQQQQLALANQK